MMDNKKKKTVLVVDDQHTNLKLVATVLDGQYELILVNSGAKCLRIAKEKLPDLILLDIMMPEMDGYETCKQLKVIDKVGGIPVIFLTAKTEERDITKAFESGGVDYVIKPFRSRELLARVKTHLEIRDSQQKVEKLNIYLDELNKHKDKIFSVISHDLQSSANQVDMMVDVLMADPINENPRFGKNVPLNMLKKSSQEGRELVEGLLSWAGNQFGKITFHPKPIYLLELVSTIEKQMRLQAEQKRIQCAIDISNDIQIVADENMFGTVLRNLLSNAIKYSEEAGKIKISAIQDEFHNIIKIKDYGVGMDEESLAKALDTSVHFTTQGTTGEKGAGFGLDICQDFVHAHNGQMALEGVPHQGCTITIRLPLRTNMKYDNGAFPNIGA